MRGVARRFGVHVNTVKRMLQLLKETGGLVPRPIPGASRQIGPEHEASLRARLEAAPNATVLENCAWWEETYGQHLSEATMWRAMRRLGWTHKKKVIQASERDEEARQHWREEARTLNPQHLVFVDESSTHTALTRLYGWAPHDKRAVGHAPRNQGKNTTLVAALTVQGIQAPWALEGAMDARAFERYITSVLAPTLQPGQIVVLDNLSVHKAAQVQEAITARGAQLLFLPSYSPDFTPIEQAFSKMKAVLRKLGCRTRDTLLDALAVALEAITPQDAVAWFSHAGYPMPALSP